MTKKKKKNPQAVKFSPKSYLRQRARTLPIYKCWINSGWDKEMFGNVIVARQHDNGRFTIGSYLVDLLENGLKESFAMVNEPKEILLKILDNPDVDFEETDYDFAHNMVYGGKEYGEEQGARGDKEFSWTQYVLEEDTEDIPLVPIPFGGEDGFFEDEEGDPMELGVNLLMGFTDVAYLDTFGEGFMNPEFANKREAADRKVVFNENDRPPVKLEEESVYAPFLEELDDIDESDLERFTKVKEDILKEIEISPEVFQLYDIVSNIYLKLDEPEKAYEMVQKSVRRFSDNYTARFFSAINLIKMDKLEEAESLIWGAYDVKDLKGGQACLGEFNVYLFYSLRCKYHMAKGEYDKAEIYYVLVRDLHMDSGDHFLSNLQLEILMEYSEFKKRRVEEHYGKELPDIMVERKLFEKYNLLED